MARWVGVSDDEGVPQFGPVSPSSHPFFPPFLFLFWTEDFNMFVTTTITMTITITITITITLNVTSTLTSPNYTSQ